MAVEVLATLMLAVAALHGLGGKLLIYATLIIMSSARAFEAPTLSTLIPAVVPREWLPRATAPSSSGGQIAQIAGPALGGVGYGLGAGWICGRGLVPDRPRRRRRAASRPPGTLFAGITFIFQRQRRLLARVAGPVRRAAGRRRLRCPPPRTSCRPAPRWAHCARVPAAPC